MQMKNILLFLGLAGAAAALPTQVSKVISNTKRQAPVESTIWGDRVSGSPDFWDDNWANVTLPFPISFYGVSYNNFWVSINGILSPGPDQILFPDTSSGAQNHIPVNPNVGAGTPRPDREWVPEKALFVLWEDLFIEFGELHEVWTTVSGSAPSRSISFSWKGSSYGTVGGNIVVPQFSATFREARPNVARIEYTNVADNGVNAAIGIQSYPAGVEWSYQTASFVSGDTLVVDMNTQAFVLI
ncbi:hypothetical protein TWF281_009042 [Arthrobotrys megalospora]